MNIRPTHKALALVAVLCALFAGHAPAQAAEPTVRTIAGTGVLGYDGDGRPAVASQITDPHDILARPDGSILFADAGGNRIRRVSPTGIMTTIAGTGIAGYSGDGGSANSAQVSLPDGLSPMPDGGFIFADINNSRVRRVWASGIITTIAGTGSPGYSGDHGPAVAAQLNGPRGTAIAADGSVLIADTDNFRIRRISADGNISTVAGSGINGFEGDGAPAVAAQMSRSSEVAVTTDGGFVFTETTNRIRKVSPQGIITTAAGTGVTGFEGDGGPAVAARLNNPDGLDATPDGGFIFTDYNSHRIRRVAADGIINTVVGTGAPGYSGDNGPAVSTQINSGDGVEVAPDGKGFYFSDVLNGRVRYVDLDLRPAASSTDDAYRLVASDGGVFSYATAFHGAGVRGTVVGALSSSTADGYWLIYANGAVTSHGDATDYGSAASIRLSSPIVAAARTSSGNGYWLIAGDGGVFSHGDATFHGSLVGHRLNAPIIAATSTPSGSGYWLVAADGGVFAFGDARFYGSTAGDKLRSPVTAIAPSPSGNGYWLVAGDGGVFAFGDAAFHGSAAGTPINQRVVGVRASNSGAGYLLVASDGGVFAFGDAPFHGSAASIALNKPIVAIVD